MSIEAMKQALEALEHNRKTHHYCEDTWYSCPKHEEGCANDSEGDECNCGADKANDEIDAAITSLRQAIATEESSATQEPVKLVKYNCKCGRTMKFESEHGVIAPKREWVGLTDEERKDIYKWGPSPSDAVWLTESKLKEKNT